MSLLTRLIGKAPTSAAEKAAAENTSAVAPGTGDTGASRPIQRGAATLEFGDELVRLALGAQSHPEQRAAQKRLAELIDSQGVRFDQLPATTDTTDALLNVAALCSDPKYFESIAPAPHDEARWLQLATSGSSTKLRQLAAQRVESEGHLRKVLKSARDSDKNVYRIAKAKLDEIHAAAKRAADERAHKLSIAENIERHSYRAFDGAYVATLEHLVKEWQSLPAEVPQDIDARVNTAIDRARESITSHIQAAGAQAARETAMANAEPLRQNTILELQQMLAAVYAAPELDAAGIASVNERIPKLDERWHDTLQYKAASAPERSEFERLKNAVQKLVAACTHQGSVQQQLAALATAPTDAGYAQLDALLADASLLPEQDRPGIVTAASEASQAWRQQQGAQRAAVADAERQLTQLIRRAQHALASGQSRPAMGIRRSIDSKLKQLPKIPKHIAERLEQLDEKLRELQDWKNFAVIPKRGELIERMQALIGVEEEPAKLAEQIKELQEEWKSLAKGSTDTEEDWTKFHEASQAAYQPCREYFEAQAQLRERNLERRKALVAKLTNYEQTTEWEHVEWKHVANALRAAKQEWRDSGPSERAATKPLEKAFDALIDKIQARLDAEYAANLERKQTLVQQAQRLAAIEDAVQASNEVKRLQNAWREVGLTHHAEGQRLWEEFKQLCDGVFDKRRQQQTERMSELKHTEAQAIALCEETEQLSKRTGAELYSGAARIRELREAFNHLGELPRESTQRIERRIGRALEDFDRAVAQQRKREAEGAWDHFFDAANRVRLHQLEGTASAEELRAHLDSIQHWPKGGAQAIERKLAQSANASTTATEAALREIAIRAEIASGQPTPVSDQTQRRTMQLQALVNGTGRTTASTKEQLEALAFEWVAAGPVSSPLYEELFARFRQAWEASR